MHLASRVAEAEEAEANGNEAPSRWRVLPVKPLAAKLDMRQEVLETMLSHLEVAHPAQTQLLQCVLEYKQQREAWHD